MKRQSVYCDGSNKIFVIYFCEINFRHQTFKHHDMKAYKRVKFNSMHALRHQTDTSRRISSWYPSGSTVRGSNPGRARFSARPDRPCGPPSLLYNGYRLFPGGKIRPGRAADHSSPSSAADMEDQSYISTHPLGHTKTYNGDTLHLGSQKN